MLCQLPQLVDRPDGWKQRLELKNAALVSKKRKKLNKKATEESDANVEPTSNEE
jgi:hypothetical protein